MAELPYRYYVAELNPHSAHLPGIPLRDLTRAEYDALAPLMQRSVDAAPFYAKEAQGEAAAPKRKTKDVAPEATKE